MSNYRFKCTTPSYSLFLFFLILHNFICASSILHQDIQIRNNSCSSPYCLYICNTPHDCIYSPGIYKSTNQAFKKFEILHPYIHFLLYVLRHWNSDKILISYRQFGAMRADNIFYFAQKFWNIVFDSIIFNRTYSPPLSHFFIYLRSASV